MSPHTLLFREVIATNKFEVIIEIMNPEHGSEGSLCLVVAGVGHEDEVVLVEEE